MWRNVFLLPVYIKVILIIDLGGKTLRIAMVMALMLMLLASTAYASSSAGSISVDIIGSKVGNTQISIPGAGPSDVELVGSTAGDVKIAPEVQSHHKECYCCGDPWYDYKKPLCYPYSSYIPARYDKQICYPQIQTNQHFGVDAWYGTYWYSPIYLPKWPQI